MASATLRDFYQRVCNYYRLASPNADFRHFSQDGACILEASNVRASVCHESQDVFAVLMVRYMRFLYQRELDPLWMELVLHGLAEKSRIGRSTLAESTRFSDMMGSVFSGSADEEEDDDR